MVFVGGDGGRSSGGGRDGFCWIYGESSGVDLTMALLDLVLAVTLLDMTVAVTVILLDWLLRWFLLIHAVMVVLQTN